MEGWPQLEEAAAALLPAGVVVRVRSVRSGNAATMPAVWEAWCEGYATSRRLEFLSGRRAALDCLEFLGGNCDPAALGIGSHREPCWPPGFCGSIAHTREWAVAAVARVTEVCSVGVDLEETGRLSHKSWRLVLTQAEQAWLTGELTGTAQDSMATLLFSLKESFYKWQYPLTRKWLGFQEATISPLSARESGVAVLTVFDHSANRDLAGRSFRLHYACGAGWVLAVCTDALPTYV